MEIITLDEAFRKGEIKLGDYFEYNPIPEKYVLKKELTGWYKNQVFTTEELKWRIDKISKDIILIADNPTTAKVFLKGKTAYRSGTGAISPFCHQLYLDPDIAYRATCITGRVQDNMDKCHVRNMSKYWLEYCITFGSGYNGDTCLAIECICNGKCYGYVYVYSNGRDYSEALSVRPVVFLKPDAQMIKDTNSDGSKENPWRFFKK